MKSNTSFSIVIILPFIILSIQQGTAQDNNTTKRISNYNLEKGLAIQGYDPVSYFTGGKGSEGKEIYSYIYNGVTYHFSSKSNLDLFKVNPANYEPAFGGWCAYAMGNDGSKVEIDPQTYKITDGKLYLFYNFYFTNTLKKWNLNETGLQKKAELNWGKFINK